MERWRLLESDGVAGTDGLAFDEALMAGYARGAPTRPPTLRLYTYRSHVALIGRYQHLEAEVDLAACARTGTDVNRRPTGGGAIVMGAGQLGVAVVTRAPAAERPKELLERYSAGIVAGLRELGIEARFRGKNDLEVGGRKIAGLGLYLDGNGALLFHSSVLADLDVEFMLEVLQIPAAKLGDKAVSAVRERVTTVTAETGGDWAGATLRGDVANGFAKALDLELVEEDPETAEIAATARLVDEKYSTEDWLHLRSPQKDATATSVVKTPAGLVRCYVALNGDTIKSALFTGDFNELPAPLVRIEEALRWKRLERTELVAAGVRAAGHDTGLGVPAEVLVDAVLDAGARALAAREARAAPLRDGSCYFPEAE